MAAWDEMWQRRIDTQAKQANAYSKKALADERTDEAQKSIASLEKTLTSALKTKNAVSWDALKDKSAFPRERPVVPVFSKPKPKEPAEIVIRREPQRSDPKYQPRFTVFDKLFASARVRKTCRADEMFNADHLLWENEERSLIRKAESLANSYYAEMQDWESEKQEGVTQFETRVQKWEEARQAFIAEQQGKNASVDRRRDAYLRCDPGAVLDCCEMVLASSEYTDTFPQEFDLDYIHETKTLIVDYSLPSIDRIPSIKEVKYIQSRDELSEIPLAEGALQRLYDSVLYQICLRTIHELYDADVVGALDSVVFNGWVQSVDRATGKDVNACILSVQTMRDEFNAINISKVDPKACFKSLKGIGSSKLHSLSAIAPILKISREDRRFIPSYEVADELDESSNIAAMDWEDFEHLIRELFAKEFAEDGGEVKVTRASRDGGVDAVAFDPDPIRGGKIVIQAKRYTNTVGVSAVRDLYGTVVNEGTTKGILVSTADYGPDAYEFAKDKPLTLLSGSNLLHLLAKHGYKAKIDLKEAKRIIAERERQDSSS